MEENTNQEPQQTQEKPPFTENQSNVSFPSVNQQNKSGGAKTILIAGTLLLIAILGFVVYKSATKNAGTGPEASPLDNLTTPSGETTVSTPTSTPKSIDRSGVSISIQNGTGISGEAAYLQTQLKNLGYTDVKVSNASSQNATTTTVTFSNSLSQDVVSEITQELNSIYQKVTASTSTSSTTDVVIVTGLRKGATSKPSATPTASPSPKASPTATPTPTPTP